MLVKTYFNFFFLKKKLYIFPVIDLGISLLLMFLMSCMTNADAEMQEEIDTYISQGMAAFSLLILVCSEISLLLT